jgi:ribosome-associated protein
MGRRKRGFEWTSDPEDPTAVDQVVRLDKRIEKDRRKAMDPLIVELEKLPPNARKKLPLTQATLEAITVLVRVPPNSARRRQMLLVKKTMRDTDLDELRAALDGDTVHAERVRLLERWRDRLLRGDDDELQAFVDEFSDVDRGRLRALIRQGRKEGTAATRARRQLFLTLGKAMPPVDSLADDDDEDDEDED